MSPVSSSACMNTLHRCILFAGVIALCSAALAQNGSISGRVQNEATGQYLSNARVAVKGTGLTALTDETGTFRLSGVPGGAATLEAFYSGLDPQQVMVNVSPGQNI